MSGHSSYGLVIVYIASLVVGITSLIIGAFWYCGLSLWASILATFGFGVVLISTWFGIWGFMQQRTIRHITREMKGITAIWFCIILIVGGIYWLLSNFSLTTILIFIPAYVSWFILANRIKIKIYWHLIFIIATILFGIWANEYFFIFSLGLLLVTLGLHIALNYSLRVYLALVKSPNVYVWLNKSLSVKQLYYIFSRLGEVGISEFITYYASNFIHSTGDNSVQIPINKNYELVFWDLLAKGQSNLAQLYVANGYAPALLAFNFDFMKQWLVQAQNQALSLKELEKFSVNYLETIAAFIENPEYYQCYAYKEAGLEQKIDDILTQIPKSWESLNAAYGLIYTAIGISLHLKEPEY